jgi:hypothetical protein
MSTGSTASGSRLGWACYMRNGVRAIPFLGGYRMTSGYFSKRIKSLSMTRTRARHSPF